jgi:hypothetical protein
MREINEYTIKLSGKASIPKELQTGRNYNIAVEMCCDGYEVKDAENGKDNIVYSMKPFGQVIISNPEGKKIYSTMKGKKSVTLRMAIMRLYDRVQPSCEFEIFYEQEMNKLIAEKNNEKI